MTIDHAVPGGASRPGPRHSIGIRDRGPEDVGRRGCWREATTAGDTGAMTVEAAFAVVGLVAVVLALSWCLSLLGAQLAVGEAARAAARSAARGDDASAVRLEARRLVPGASVELSVDGGHVLVEVSREVRPPGGLARWGSVRLVADSTASLEAP